MKTRFVRRTFVSAAIAAISLLVSINTHAGSPSTLTVEVYPFPATVGSDLTFTLVLTNNGGFGGLSSTISNTLPSSVNLVSLSNSVGTISQSLGVVTWTIPNIAEGTDEQAKIVVTPTVIGTITNITTYNINGGPSSLPLIFPIDVDPSGPDLSATVSNVTSSCTNTSKATTCTITGTLDLADNGAGYLHSDFTLSQSCKLPPKVGCKITAALAGTTFDEVTLINLPAHTIAFYLSDDDTLDGADALVASISSNTLLKALVNNKAPKVKFKVPKGVALTGKFLIVKVDGGGSINESDEANNTAVIGPLP